MRSKLKIYHNRGIKVYLSFYMINHILNQLIKTRSSGQNHINDY